MKRRADRQTGVSGIKKKENKKGIRERNQRNESEEKTGAFNAGK